jgi:hypothetical protein
VEASELARAKYSVTDPKHFRHHWRDEQETFQPLSQSFAQSFRLPFRRFLRLKEVAENSARSIAIIWGVESRVWSALSPASEVGTRVAAPELQQLSA